MPERWLVIIVSLAFGLLLGGVLAWIGILHERAFPEGLRGSFAERVRAAADEGVKPLSHPGLVAATASFYALAAGLAVLAWLSPVDVQPWVLAASALGAAGTIQGLYRGAKAGRLAESVRHAAEGAARVLASPLGSIITFIVVAALVLGVGGLVAAGRSNGEDDQTERASVSKVPSLLGMTLGEARGELESVGLGLGTVTESDAQGFAPGEVIDQSPEPGTSLPVSGAVDVVVARGGAATTTVPTITGRSLAEAEIELKSSGLEVGEVSEQPSEEFDAGIVISQTPEPGAEVARGTPVDLVVSSGPAGVTVPSVLDMSLEQAEETLASAGLEVGTVSAQQRSDVDPGIVISQTPQPSSEVAPGTEVDLVVSEEPIVE